MSPLECWIDKSECTQLCVDFANAIDARDYERFLDLFTEDGTLNRSGETFIGRAEIRRFLSSRPTAMVTRHLCANIRIELRSDTEAIGMSYALFFQSAAEEGHPFPLPASLPVVVEYHDTFARTAAGWRFSQRKISPIFKT